MGIRNVLNERIYKGILVFILPIAFIIPETAIAEVALKVIGVEEINIADSLGPKVRFDVLELKIKALLFNNPDSAFLLAMIMKEEAENADNDDTLAIAYSLAGSARYVQGKYDQALEYFIESYNIWKRKESQFGMVVSLNNIATVYNVIEKQAKAIAYHREAIRIAKEIKDTLRWGKNLFNMGVAYESSGKYDSALLVADSALNIYMGLNDKQEIYRTLNLKGMNLIKINEFGKAKPLFLKILSDEEYQNTWEESYAYSGLAKCYYAENDFEKAEKYALVSFDLATQVNAQWDLVECSKLLSEIYEGNGKLKEALFYFKLHKQYNDSLFSKAKEDQLNYLQLKLKEDQNALLQQENEIKEQIIGKKNNLLLGFIIVVVLTSLIAFILYRNNKTKNKLNRELQIKNSKIADQNKKLVQLNATKDKLFRIIAHDLKSPIGIVVSFTDDLVSNFNDYDKETLLEVMTTLNKSSKQGIRLLDNLLNWARSQTGLLAYRPSRVEIYNLIEESVKLYSKLAEDKDISIHIEVPQEMVCTLDNNITMTILRNLLSNSIKFTGDGGLIKVKAVCNTDGLVISVWDNGVGIENHLSDKLFQIEEQLTTPGTRYEKGTGLGLVLCKDLAEKQGGKIWFESEYGKGTTFYFSIPLPV